MIQIVLEVHPEDTTIDSIYKTQLQILCSFHYINQNFHKDKKNPKAHRTVARLN